jgi:hypothetical protein
MRFLSVAACALAASLLSTPSQAVYVETHGGEFTVYGPIPEPINIFIGYGIDLTFTGESFNAYNGDGWQVAVYAYTQYSWTAVGEVRSPSGMHLYPEYGPNYVTLSDTDRTISISMQAGAYGNVVLNDAWGSFSLPDNLSIAAPVPEPASWALMLLGFAGIALVRRCRPSRACRA